MQHKSGILTKLEGLPARMRHVQSRCGDSCAATALPMKISHFPSVSRSTMMSIGSAAGKTGLVLLIFKGRNLPYRNVLRGRIVRTETLADYIPLGAIVAFRGERGGVHSATFWVGEKRFSPLWVALQKKSVSSYWLMTHTVPTLHWLCWSS